MKGSILIGGTLIAAAAAGLGLWYTSTLAFYYEVEGVTSLPIAAEDVQVSDYRGIDADTSPLKMRACFRLDRPYTASDTLAEVAEPLVAPNWFDCFNAREISLDIKAGRATVLLSRSNVPYGFDTFIAHYPDGRAFMWRQINPCGDAQFSGNDLPQGCPDPNAPVTTIGAEPTADNDADTELRLTPVIGQVPQPILARDVTVANSSGNPEAFHACFKTEMSLGLLSETYQLAEAVEPVNAPDTLPCFDADQIAADVASGAALALVGEREIAPSVDRIIAVYNDGRGFAWHQNKD